MRCSQEPCRYYVNGLCSKGNSCTFLHDVENRNDSICHFNLAGKCSYGQSCRFLHVRPRNEERPTTSSPSVPSTPPRPSFSVPPPPIPTRVRPVQLQDSRLNAEAAEFVPSWLKDAGVPATVSVPAPVRSYASAASSGLTPSSSSSQSTSSSSLAWQTLCPYYERHGQCRRREGDCQFVHGDHCDMCNSWSLHPYNEESRKAHQAECLALHHQEMERAFMIQKMEDKSCGICMENIAEKNLRFGILNNCQHCFCLDCIRQWRSRDQESVELATKTVRSCPECRQHSDYVIPSMFWVEAGDEKTLLIQMYKENMKIKVCKYYSNVNSRGDCPFGNKCFYKHQLPDGSIDPGESPHVRRRARLSDFLFDGLNEYLDDDDEEFSSGDIDYDDILDALLRNSPDEQDGIIESVSAMLAGLRVDREARQ